MVGLAIIGLFADLWGIESDLHSDDEDNGCEGCLYVKPFLVFDVHLFD